MSETRKPSRRNLRRQFMLACLAAPAFAEIWGGWIGLGTYVGFGVFHPFPGIPYADGFAIDARVLLPLGIEAFGAFALSVWLASDVATDSSAARFARWTSVLALAIGMAGQVTYRILVAPVGASRWVVIPVGALPVCVLGLAMTLMHLLKRDAERKALAELAGAAITATPVAPEWQPRAHEVPTLPPPAAPPVLEASAPDPEPGTELAVIEPDEPIGRPEPTGGEDDDNTPVTITSTTVTREVTATRRELAHRVWDEVPDYPNATLARELDCSAESVRRYRQAWDKRKAQEVSTP